MKKILLIEDDSILVQMYEIKFKHAGFEVEIATDGRQGLEKIRLNRPDLVLLDIVMPRLDGRAFLNKIRFDDELKKIPVAILTNIDNAKDKTDFLKKGAVGYFIKSESTPSQVVKRVQEILEERN